MLSQIYHPNPLLGIDYASYSPSLSRFYHPPTPPYTYPYDYQQIYGPQKSEDRLRINLDIYPHFPSPPLSVSPPQEESIPLSKTAASENCRTTSVIMRVSDQKIVESKSDAEEEFICRWIHCSRQFDSLDNLASHVTQAHAIASFGGLYFCCWEGCPRTDRGFNARYKMLVHVRTHTKEKPHQCQLCEKSFSRAENLKIHTRSHSGEKPYRCPVQGCNKAYSNSSDRFKHTRTHSTEKPYVCKVPGCQKRYTDPSSLRKHVKTFKHTPLIENCDASRTTEKPTPSPRAEENVSMVNYQNYSTEILERAKVPLCSEVSCGPECFDHHYHNKSRIYTFGSYVSEVFPAYDSQSDKTPSPPSYWINSGTHKIDVEEEEMDLDLPLDLSMNRSHR